METAALASSSIDPIFSLLELAIRKIDRWIRLQVDQAQLETVLPSPGGTVLILRGPHTGEKGTLKSIDVDKFQAQVALRDGTEKWMEYEDMSKFNTG